MDLTALKLNKYQTKLTNELLSQQPEIVVEWIDDAITNHEFIRRLIRKDRPYAKDCERDELGRAKLELTNPYIMTDADYFRQSALYFQEHGVYTHIKRNPNPNSEYMRFWKEEIRRCWEGMVRPEDGAWVTGFEYFYLNYYQMPINIIKEGSRKATRVKSFPLFFELIDWRYHYKDMAREGGHHCIELSKRGSSKSHCVSSDLAHNLILGENKESKEGIIGVIAASDKTYLKEGEDGTLSKFTSELAFLKRNTPFPHLMLTQSANEMSWIMGYREKDGSPSPDSSRNTVLGISMANESDKLRGKRGWIYFEEMGNFPNLLDAYNASRRNCEDGDYAFAIMSLIGTANNKESNFESAKTLLYKPSEHNLLSIPNVFDEPNKGREEFGLFTGAYLNRLGCFNKDGVSDVTKALLQIMNARFKAYQSGESATLLRVIAEDPIDPAEAMIQSRKAFFPVMALNERLAYLNAHPEILNRHLIGTLVMTDKGDVEFRPTKDRPLRHWNRSRENAEDANLDGAIEIFQEPQKSTRTGKIIEDRYIVSCDPIDQEQGQSASLFSSFVFDRMTNRIVAEYTGRREISDQNYEIVRLLCFYYNARCMFENNIHGLYSYFKQYNCTYLLYDTPEYLKAMDKIHYNGKGVTTKGIRATKPVNDYANDLIRDWLLSPDEDFVVDEEGNEVTTQKSMLYTIESPALLEELIGYYDKANVDRIRALGMAMLARESYLQEGVDLINEDGAAAVDKDYFGNSDFFKKMYDKKVSKRYQGFDGVIRIKG